MRRRYKGRESPIPKLCQNLRRRPPTLEIGSQSRRATELRVLDQGPPCARCRDRPPAPQARGPYAKKHPAQSPKTKRGFIFDFQSMGLGRLELPTSRLSGASAGVGITAGCRKT